MNFDIPKSELDQIEKAIASDKSVVGIDAKKTHIIIIHMLKEIQASLDRLERRVEQLEKG